MPDVKTLAKQSAQAPPRTTVIPWDALVDDLQDALVTPKKTRKVVQSGAKGAMDGERVGFSRHDFSLDPDKARGTARVANGASHESNVVDGASYTSALLGYEQEHPEWSEDYRMTMAGRDDINTGGDISVATSHQRGGFGQSGRKHATLVCNSVYDDRRLKALPGAASDAAALKGNLESKGYDAELQSQATGDGIRAAFEDRARQARPGDEVTLHYSGHGVQEGLLGFDARPTVTEIGVPVDLATGKLAEEPLRRLRYDSLCPHSVVGDLAARAVGEGWHLTAIIDACESGGVKDAVEYALSKYMRRHDDVKTTDFKRSKAEMRQKGFPMKTGRERPLNFEEVWNHGKPR